MYYYGLRFFSSELGRWLNRDPVSEYGGINMYVFINNQSINQFDILGLNSAALTLGLATPRGPSPHSVAFAVGFAVGTVLATQSDWLGGGFGETLYDQLHPPYAESTSKRRRKYGSPPIVIDTSRPCPDNPCEVLETCEQLRARGFKYTDRDMARRALLKALPGLISHAATDTPEDEGLVYHENFRWKSDPSGKKGQPASIMGAECCENGMPPPITLYKWKTKIGYW